MTRTTLTWRTSDLLTMGRDLEAVLVTRHGETVGELSRGRAAGGFYWRLYKPAAMMVADDPEALRCREAMGQDAVAAWAGPFRQRRQAAADMLRELDRRSIGLLGVDDLDLPTWNGPCIGEPNTPKQEL
jgi:hypothetical protein